MPYAIVRCTCLHIYQSARYGLHRRLANYAPSLYNGDGGYRCTVCTSIHPLHSHKHKPTKDKP